MGIIVCDVETSGLDPTVDYLTMVGLLGSFGVTCTAVDINKFNTDPLQAEKEMLEGLVKLHMHTNANNNDALVTYNGKHFDIGFLKTRLMLHNLAEPAFMRSTRHYDLMSFATEINGTRISKDWAASTLCGLYVPKTSSGKLLALEYSQRIVTEADHFAAIHHNLQDLITTRSMFEKWKDWPLFKKHYAARGL